MLKKIRHILEYIPIWLIYQFCQFFSFSQVSSFGARLGRLVGRYYLSYSQVADQNLQRIFPNLSPEERLSIIKKSCEHFGRIFLEYFVLHKANKDPKYKATYIGADKMKPFVDSGKPFMYVSAHMDNWEVGAMESARMGLPLVPIYRHINNPYVNALILRCRSSFVVSQIAKGPKAGFQSLRAIKKGERLVCLGDQKYNQGPDIPFFGHNARTADGFVKLAQVANIPLIPIHVRRCHDVTFEIIIEDPIAVEPAAQDLNDLLKTVNEHIERWILQHPEQWFVFHRRWDKSYYKQGK